MLLRFEVANHRSIKDPVELSMIAVDEDRPAARGFDRLPEKVLTLASIYGANASGKSNVLQAIAWLSAAVDSSLRQWGEFVPREPFRFGDGKNRPSTFEVEMMTNDIRYVYHVEVNDSEVLFESLASYPERRRRVLFEREGMDLHLRRGLTAAAGARNLLTPTTLALSAAMRFEEPEISPFGRDLSGIFDLNLHRAPSRQPGADSRRRLPSTASIFGDDFGAEPSDDRALAISMLRLADLGIDDVEVLDIGTMRGDGVRKSLQLVHRAGDHRSSFHISEESDGTRVWFSLIGPVLAVLRAGGVLLLDEIDASLHPLLSAYLLTLFQDPGTNPRNAQLIFTTHDTSLLNHLNRDEVWLTDKADDGSTSLTALAEYGGDKVRRSTNLERAYLQGRFGAVPQVDQFTLRHALGMLGDG
ncbi:ATP/GTP-binding protein [Actinoplanes sp. NPDC000266]